MIEEKLLDHHIIYGVMGGVKKNLENHMPTLEKGSHPFKKDVQPKQESARPDFKFPLPKPILSNGVIP